MNGRSAYLAFESDINFGDTTHGHSRRGVESTEFLDKSFGNGRVGFEIFELVWVL